YTFPITARFEQHKMDWTTFYASTSVVDGDDVYTNGNKEAKGNVSNLPDGTKVINMNNGSDWRPIEFKVIDTNIKDLDYKDIVTKWEGYGGSYTALGFNGNYAMIQSGAGGVTSTFQFAQVHEEDIESYDYDDDNITYTTRHGGDGLINTFDGNGWQFHTRSFAAGKYYIAKITNENSTNTDNYIVIAFRVPGDSGNWVRANASDNSDPDKVPLPFHRGTNVVDGTVFYDATDLGLAGIAVYNGNHISLTTDGSCTLNVPDNGQEGDPHWHMTIQYAHLDEENDNAFTAGIAADDLAEIGTDPGVITLNPTNEVFGWQGKNTLLIKMPELIDQIPIHSPEGGSTGEEYYLLKVYYDDVEHPGECVNIPLKMVPNVPAIIEPQEYTVRATMDAFHVHFTETNAQAAEDYKYTFYVKLDDGEFTQITGVTKDGVQLDGGVATEGGNYVLPLNTAMQEALQTNGSDFTVKVVAEWCQQETSVSEDYEVELKDGTVDVEGFQINTNTAEGGVSEYMPTFRAVAHSSKYFLGKEGELKDKMVAVEEQGIIFAQTEKAGTVNASTMTIDETNDYIDHIKATAAGMHDWGGKEIDTNYFSLTIKEMNYFFDNLEKEYSFRAYAKLSNGEIRYGSHIYTVSTYEIAQNLYENQKMPTKEGHNFLYNEVLNIVSMNKHANQIFNAMYKAIKPQFGETINQTTYTNYLQKFSKDMVYYTQCINGYKYKTRPVGSEFVSVQLGTTVQGQLLDALNNAQEANYDTVFDWIKNETSNYSTKGTPYQGFYKEVEYGWENAYSGAFATE
ncbi:MAG: hypothetical protein K6G85_06960, partial [Eubacterium sp.]|nr:hypothetical protein [Eubacterium sp.]